MRVVSITSSKFDEIFNVHGHSVLMGQSAESAFTLETIAYDLFGHCGSQSRIWLHTMGHSADQALDKIQTVSHVYAQALAMYKLHQTRTIPFMLESPPSLETKMYPGLQAARQNETWIWISQRTLSWIQNDFRIWNTWAQVRSSIEKKQEVKNLWRLSLWRHSVKRRNHSEEMR